MNTDATTYDRYSALDAVDAVRATLHRKDDWKVAEITRKLWDGYPIQEAKDYARHRMVLADYDAERRLQAILARTADDGRTDRYDR